LKEIRMTDVVHGSRLIKNSVFVLFNTLFMYITGWIISIWVARQLGPSNYGIFNLVLWFTDSFTWFIAMGLTHAVTKFIAEFKGRNELDALTPIVVFVLKIEIILCLVTTTVLLFFNTQIAHYFFTPKQSIFFVVAFIGILPGMITAIFSATIDGIQKFEYFTYANLILTPLSFFSKIVVLWMGKGILGLLIVMLVFSFLNVAFYAGVLAKERVLTWRNLRRKLDPAIRGRILRYNTSVLAILLCDKIVWDKSENFFLGRLCHSEQIAFYNLGYNIAQKLVSFLPFMFWRILFPAMSQFFGSGDRDKMKRLFFLSTRYLAFAAFPMGTAGFILAYQIIHYLYGHDFIGAQRALQIIFVSSVFTSLSNPASAILYGYEKQSFIYKYGAVLACFNILLDILLIKSHGAIGAAVAYAITTLFASVGGLFYTCRTMKLDYPFQSLFKIFFSTIIMGTVMEMIILHNHEIPGFVMSLAAGAVVYLTCSMVLGTFVKEDYVLLRHAQHAVSGKTALALGAAISFLEHFKQGHDVSGRDY
jgi:O-antigen/teichoic acid export membrane protein